MPKKTMSFWQKVLHIFTSTLLAFASFKFLSLYPVLEFNFAPHAVSTLLFVAYLMLSRRYDPFFSVLFFLFAFYAGQKAWLHELPAKKSIKEQRVRQFLLFHLPYMTEVAKAQGDLSKPLQELFSSEVWQIESRINESKKYRFVYKGNKVPRVIEFIYDEQKGTTSQYKIDTGTVEKQSSTALD